MRKGRNPARNLIPAYSPNRLGMSLLVYIPHQEGYFEQAFEIFKIQVASLRQYTGVPFDLLVYDNGSCAQVQQGLQTLQSEGWIDWLFLSRHNMGKTGALNWILSAMPNEIIGYADSDVFFRSGWYQASLEILESFPGASMVSAQVNYYNVLRSQPAVTLKLKLEEYERGEFKPDTKDVDEYCLGVGVPEEAEKDRKMVFTSYRHRSSGVLAVLSSSHMQFIGRRDILRQVLPLPATMGIAPKETKQFDYRLHQAGYVALSTTRAYVYHMGNSIDDYIRPELDKLGKDNPSLLQPAQLQSVIGTQHSPMTSWKTRLVTSRLFGDLFLRLYKFLFRVYSERS